MASGTITINLQSIDYTGRGASRTCYDASNAWMFDRGNGTATTTVNWVVNDSNIITFSDGGTTTTRNWRVCSDNGYHLEIQFSEDGASWTTIADAFANSWPCVDPLPATHGVERIASTLIPQLQPFQLTKSGYIRMYTWTTRACPTSALPNAYPNQAGSQAVAVPIYIEVDYRPGEIKKNNAFASLNRDGGKCDIKKSGAWSEMKTQDGGTGTGNPPLIRKNNAWVNQNKFD